MPPKAPVKAANSDSLEPGMHCLCYHPQHAWVHGIIDSFDGKHVTVSVTAPQAEQLSKLQPDDVFVCDERAMSEDVNDLLNLSVLHDGTLLNCLRSRYMRDIVYTNIGAIVVAFNPFNFKIPWYMDAKMPDYLAEGPTIQHNLPHSWAVAHTTYYEMRESSGNQCILVSGESGAGKTEAAKIVMKYLGAVSALQGDEKEKEAGYFVSKRMMQSNPILEAFGNAKTVRNDNSSRFGKLMKIKFDSKGFLCGADITKYLLEKSRIITSALDERVYHSFYLALKGKDHDTFQLEPIGKYRSINTGKAPDIPGVDDKEEYDIVNEAMGTCGIEPEFQKSVWYCVSGVLSLLNLDFVAKDTDSTEFDPKTIKYITDACRFFSIDEAILKVELLTTTLQFRDGPVTKPLTVPKAIDGRDSLCKSVYDNLFGWLVTTINKTMDTDRCASWIALLDIFGFEDFKVNSFEQLCINLTNETLQHHYNSYIFTRDMEECRAEGIDVTEIVFPDNTPCVNMVSGKGGILALLDEDCLLAKATDLTFLDKITDALNGKTTFFERPRVSKTPCFRVVHYAGTVSYDVEGFIEKNRDTLKDAFKLLMNNSTDKLVQELLPKPNPDAAKFTVGGFFKSQLKDLMDLINSTNPHWIRCIKPHPAKKPLHFDGVQSLLQLRSSGVLGTVQIRKAGYPIRIQIPDFAKKYKVIVRDEPLNFSDGLAVSKAILKTAGFDSHKAQMGISRVFLKSEAYQELEVLKKKKLEVFAKTAVCAALVSLSRFRTAALMRNRSALVIQAFLMSRQSEFVNREKDFNSRKESIIANVMKLLEIQKMEESLRNEMIAEREAYFQDISMRQRNAAEDFRKQWWDMKPKRDQIVLDKLIKEEEEKRAAILEEQRNDLKFLLKVLEEDFQEKYRAQDERMAAELAAEQERLRKEEEVRREAERVRLAKEREEAEQRKEADRQVAIQLWNDRKMSMQRDLEKQREVRERGARAAQQAASSFLNALELKEQEAIMQARERAQYPGTQFRVAGADPLRDPVLMKGGARSSFSPSTRGAGSGSPGGYAGGSPTLLRNAGSGSPAFGGTRQSPNGVESPVGIGGIMPTYSDPAREKNRLDRERLYPEKYGSLDMVRRMRALQSVRESSIMCAPKVAPGVDERSPLHPNNPAWSPSEGRVIALPDGTLQRLDDVMPMMIGSMSNATAHSGAVGSPSSSPVMRRRYTDLT